MKALSRFLVVLALGFLSIPAHQLTAQDWVHTGTNLGTAIRLAAADFKPVDNDPQTPTLKAVFDATLYSDLNNAGIFDLVSKSLAPQAMPGSPQEINLTQWSEAPCSAAMVAFGALSVNNGRLVVYGWLFDTRNTQSPQVLGKQYNETASTDEAREVAHEFADEIISRLGGGVNGIAETKIYFTSDRSGSKEIWVMDYDGQNQHQVTHLHSITMSPHVSPDNSRLAFSTLGAGGWLVRMYSLELGRMVSFPAGTAGGSNLSPAWAPDGNRIAFSSGRTGNAQIYVSSADGSDLHKITDFAWPNVSPTWNPKTGAQIAWASGRTGEPQIYIMDQDGANVQRMTDGGYAVSPNWSPSGQFLTFSWNRKYGPGAPGGQDIYMMDIASKNWMQLTHDSGDNDHPCWSPDTRHIVFQRQIGNHTEIWTMLSDGTHQQQLTKAGNNEMPNWSWK